MTPVALAAAGVLGGASVVLGLTWAAAWAWCRVERHDVFNDTERSAS